MDVLVYEIKCITEGIYVEKLQWDSLSKPTTCPNDAAHQIDQDFTHVIRRVAENIFAQQLLYGQDKSSKWYGFKVDFEAGADWVEKTVYLPYAANLQGGKLPAGENVVTGDMIEMIVLKSTPYEKKYIENYYIVKNFLYEFHDQFSASADLPAQTPITVRYKSIDGLARTIYFDLLLRI